MPKAGAPRPAPTQTDEPEDIGELKVLSTPRGRTTDDLFAPYEETEEHLNVLYWGREGSGKTIDLAKATELGRVLFINAEGGLKKRALLSHGVNTENLIVFPRPGQPLTFGTIQEAILRVKSDLMDDPNSWFLVAVDSVTELYTALTDESSDARFAKSKATRREWTPDVNDEMFTDLSDYGVATKMVRRIVRMLRDLPVHVAMTALERRDVDEDTSKVAYGPAVGPALQTALLGYVDVVLYTKAADEERDYFRAQTKKIGMARAKDRLGVIPKVLVDPTFPRLVAYNEGTLVEESDEVQAVLQAEPVKAAPAGQKKPRPRPGARKAAPVAEEPAESTEEATEPPAEG